MHSEEQQEIDKHIEQQNAEIERQAQELFIKRRLNKNKREIKRLKKEVELALLSNNFVKYEYAIRKLRGIYLQPYTPELIKVQFETSREALKDLIKKALKDESTTVQGTEQ